MNRVLAPSALARSAQAVGRQQNFQARTVVARKGGVIGGARRSALTRGGGDRPPAPSFMQQPTATRPLHEQQDIIWDDGVAPEVTLDFDAPHIPRWMTGVMWFGGLGAFVIAYQYIKLVRKPEVNCKLAVPKKYDEEIIRSSLGGAPDPTPENL